MAPLFLSHFGDGSAYGLKIEYLRESEPLGTAGPLAEMELEEDRVLVMNGDLLTTLDFAPLVDGHVQSGAAATLAVRAREVAIDFGVVHVDGERVAAFDEKPVFAYDVSMGVYVFERRVVELIPRKLHFDFPDLLTAVLARAWPVHAHRSEDFWLDIGRIEDYELALERFDELRPELLPEQ
jgi:NDP-sugar pyrophosphorylase family protein